MELKLNSEILPLFETTKAARTEFVQNILSNIKDGLLNPKDVHLQLKCMQDMADQLQKNEEYAYLLLEEVDKYGKSHDYHAAKFEVKEVGVKYDFSKCDDPILIELQRQYDEANYKLKERQDFLKKCPSDGMEILDEGAVYRIYPPSKSSKTSVAVTLK